MTIVIIGGTFNPPTLAHIALAENAKNAVNADMVIFVPTKSAYMKSWKKYQNSDIYPDEVRVQAIKSCETEWLKVDTCEIDETVSGKSYDTVQYIKKKYNTDDVYFAVGSDKLDEIPRWSRSIQFLSTEKFIVMRRDDDDVKRIIEKNEKLHKYRNHFVICDSDEMYKDYSSSEVRALLLSGTDADIEKVKAFVSKSVWSILQKQILDKQNTHVQSVIKNTSVLRQ